MSHPCDTSKNAATRPIQRRVSMRREAGICCTRWKGPDSRANVVLDVWLDELVHKLGSGSRWEAMPEKFTTCRVEKHDALNKNLVSKSAKPKTLGKQSYYYLSEFNDKKIWRAHSPPRLWRRDENPLGEDSAFLLRGFRNYLIYFHTFSELRRVGAYS